MRKWRSIDFDWNHARAFLVTAEEGSLSAAAKALGLTQPTLGRQVAALEKTMGVALFEKSTTGLELTPCGLDLIDNIKEMGDAASRFAVAATGHSESLAGLVCITTTEPLAVHVLPKILVDLHQEQPDIQIELIASDADSDLRKREADIAIRAYRPTQPDLIAKKIGEEKFKLFAAQSYIDQFGIPSSDPSELELHRFVGINQAQRFVQVLQSCGLNIKHEQCHALSENSLAYWALVRAGAGIGAMHEDVGLADPSVVPVLPEVEFPTMELWLVAHRELRTSKRIRFVYNYLSDAFTGS